MPIAIKAKAPGYCLQYHQIKIQQIAELKINIKIALAAAAECPIKKEICVFFHIPILVQAEVLGHHLLMLCRNG